MSDKPVKPVKTETIVGRYDADDNLVSETVTVVMQAHLPADDDRPGYYL